MTTTHTMDLSSSKVGEWEITTYRGGSTEIYRLGADGIPVFKGYYDQLNRIEPEKIHAHVVEHVQRHRDHWRQFLPGASHWV